MARRRRCGVQLAPSGKKAAAQAIEEEIDERVQLEGVLQDDVRSPVVSGQEQVDQGKRIARAPVAGEDEYRMVAGEGGRIGRVCNDDVEAEASPPC
jgi:hypothetical protein